MQLNPLAIYGIKTILKLIREILYFPIWWYSRGLAKMLVVLKNFLRDKEKSLALFVWIKNIFRPMYAQTDWAGVLISFFMRLFQICARGFVMIFWLAAALAVFCFWLVLPVIVGYEIYFQLV